MSRDTVTQVAVVEAARHDGVLVEREDHCEILRRVVAWSDMQVPTECEITESVVAGAGDVSESAD